MSNSKKSRDEDFVPMTNMDTSQNVPGSITPEERSKIDLAKVQHKDISEIEVEKTTKPKAAGKPASRELSFLDPSEAREPIRKDDTSINVNDLPKPVRKTRSQNTTPAAEPTVGPSMPDVEESIQKQETLKKTPVKIPEGFESAEEVKSSEPVVEDPKPEIHLDHTHEPDLENEFTDTDETNLSETSQDPIDKELATGDPVNLPKDASAETETKQNVLDKQALFGDQKEETKLVDDKKTESTTETDAIIANEVHEVDAGEEKSESESDDEETDETDPANLPEGSYVKGLTEEEELVKNLEEIDKLQKTLPIAASPADYNTAELVKILDYTTTHYRIIEGHKRTALKKPLKLDPSKITVVKNTDIPDFDLQQLRVEHAANDGGRKVLVVCTQSGYTVMCSPMNSRELASFGRDDRSQVPNTFGTNMAIANAIYSKLSDFSCGAMTFEQWLSATAYPDLQTLIFGIYKATYPYSNNFNLQCTMCGENFVVPIDNDTLVMIPAGSLTQEMIREAVNGKMDPKELVKQSKRYQGIDIYFQDHTKVFRVRTPSIMEFYTRAYRGKNEDKINAFQADMYYAGYVRSVGVLDIDAYNESNGEVIKYYHDQRVESIDKAIAELSIDDKQSFERRMMDYINKYSVTYQIPMVQCPHCKRVMQQREINMRTLFFEVKSQKGL